MTMPFTLSKKDTERRNELIDKIISALHDLEKQITVHNEVVADQYQLVADALSVYNEALIEARDWVAEVATQAASEWDDKSERWQDGEKGQAAREWISAWEEFAPEEIELGYVAEIDISDADNAADMLEQLPESVDEI
jgi:hypothetical protein